MSKSTPDNNDSQLMWQYRLVATSEIPYANHDVLRRIWQNPLNPKSLRLNKKGYEWVSTCTTFTGFKFQLEQPVTNGILLQLDRLMSGPYYIVNRSLIYVYGEQDAIMIQLHGNDLKTYLANLHNQD